KMLAVGFFIKESARAVPELVGIVIFDVAAAIGVFGNSAYEINVQPAEERPVTGGRHGGHAGRPLSNGRGLGRLLFQVENLPFHAPSLALAPSRGRFHRNNQQAQPSRETLHGKPPSRETGCELSSRRTMGAIRTPYSLVNGGGEFAKGKVENTERSVTDK